MASLLSAVVAIKDCIALNGSCGCVLAQFLAQSESLSLTATQLLYIVKRFLIPEGYVVTGPSGYTFQNNGDITVDALNESICFAPDFERWKAWGIESSGEVPSNDCNDLAAVEVIAAARYRGCLLSELVDGLNYRQDNSKIERKVPKSRESSSKKRSRVDDEALGDDENELATEIKPERVKIRGFPRFSLANIHPYADKVVVSGTVIKRIVLPSRGNLASVTGPAPVTPRSKHTFAALLHLRRFACEYEPADDGLEFHAGEDVKESVFLFIRRVLQMRAKGGSMAMGDLAKFMGVNSRVTQSLREYLQQYHTEEKEDKDGLDLGHEAAVGGDSINQLRVYLSHATPLKPNGELCTVKNTWCIELIESSDPTQALSIPQLPAPAPTVPPECDSSYSCARNLGLFEGLSHAIRTRSLPLSGNAEQLGPGLTSTDAKLVTGVPAKRAYKLTSEFVSAFSYPVEKFQDGKQQRFRVRDKFQTPLQAHHLVVDAGQESDTLLNENQDFKFDLTGTVHVTQMNNVRRRDSKLEPNGRLQTFEQVHREQVAVAFLKEQGGASSRFKVESQLRKIGLASAKADIRTIRRSLTRLIKTGTIEEVILDKDSEHGPQPWCLLLLTESKSQPDLIHQTITRLKAAAAMKKRKRPSTAGESDDDADAEAEAEGEN